jgi:hypothetical protein
MHRRMLVSTALAVLAAPPLAAQEARQQDRADVTVPAYTDQARWARVTTHMVQFLVMGIAHAKARGESPEDYGRFVGERFATTAGPANTGHPVRVARAIYRNFIAFPASEAQIVSASDTSATLRYRRFHVREFGPEGRLFGVTIDEYDRASAAIHQRIAEHLGLRQEQRLDGEWNVVTIRGRGSAAVVDFPRGTYAVTLSAEDLGGRAEVAGTWELSFGADGRYAVRHNGQEKVRGAYRLRLDEIALGDETGSLACAGPGTYRWSVNARGELTLGRLADACEGRTAVFARRPLSRR